MMTRVNCRSLPYVLSVLIPAALVIAIELPKPLAAQIIPPPTQCTATNIQDSNFAGRLTADPPPATTYTWTGSVDISWDCTTGQNDGCGICRYAATEYFSNNWNEWYTLSTSAVARLAFGNCQGGTTTTNITSTGLQLGTKYQIYIYWKPNTGTNCDYTYTGSDLYGPIQVL